MALPQRTHYSDRRVPRSLSNARLQVTAETYRPSNPRGKPSLPNLYHSQLFTEQSLEVCLPYIKRNVHVRIGCVLLLARHGGSGQHIYRSQ